MDNVQLFDLIGVVAVTIVAAILILPLLKPKQAAVVMDESAQIDVVKQRYKELKQQFSDGQLAEDSFNEQSSILSQELDKAQRNQRLNFRAQWVAVAVIVIALPLITIGVYSKTGNPDALQPLHGQQTERPQMSLQDIEKMVAGLAKKLEAEPNNPEGWIMLGRSYGVLERYADSASAYSEAVKLAGDNAPVVLLLDTAQALQLAGVPEQASSLVLMAYAKEPKNPKVLWFAAMDAIRQNRLPEATGYLKEFLALNPPDDVRAVIEKQIRQLETELQ